MASNVKGAASKKKKTQKITVASTAESLATQEKLNEGKTENRQEEKLEKFTKYYKEIELVPEGEWKAFFKSMTDPPPVSFRLVESYRLLASHIDTVPGVPSQARVLARYLHTKFVDVVNQMTVGNKTPVNLAPLPWYPKELGWCVNIAKEDIDKYLRLKEFDNFLKTEKMQNTMQRLETWSMFPPTLLDIKPQHVVLDMCAAPGFMASQILEMMNAEPLQSQNGVLVLNDLFKANDKMHYQWTQGSKVVYTFFDARNYPDYYFNDKKTYQSEIKYDRVICDVRCSCDGTMRKNTGIQEQWNFKSALGFHEEQKAILKRALEVVKVKGRVLYSTTSLNPVENEAVIAAVLQETQGSVLLMDCSQLTKNITVRPGMKCWKVFHGPQNRESRST
ncbi:hypothetical protein ACF0H5_006205 [Mactra antiquata]